jgi:hypothetical protein
MMPARRYLLRIGSHAVQGSTIGVRPRAKRGRFRSESRRFQRDCLCRRPLASAQDEPSKAAEYTWSSIFPSDRRVKQCSSAGRGSLGCPNDRSASLRYRYGCIRVSYATHRTRSRRGSHLDRDVSRRIWMRNGVSPAHCAVLSVPVHHVSGNRLEAEAAGRLGRENLVRRRI